MPSTSGWERVPKITGRLPSCDNGRISVNGRVVKASYDVKVGDRIEISMGTRTVAVEVLVVAETVRKDDAAAMY